MSDGPSAKSREHVRRRIETNAPCRNKSCGCREPAPGYAKRHDDRQREAPECFCAFRRCRREDLVNEKEEEKQNETRKGAGSRPGKIVRMKKQTRPTAKPKSTKRMVQELWRRVRQEKLAERNRLQRGVNEPYVRILDATIVPSVTLSTFLVSRALVSFSLTSATRRPDPSCTYDTTRTR